MSFGEEIFKALTGREHEPTSSGEMFEAIEDYRNDIGMSRRAFAKRSGIPESTLRYWGTKGFSTKSAQANLPKLTVAFRSLIASPAAVDRWRNNDITLHLAAMPQQRRGQVPYNISARQLKLEPGTGRQVVAHFLRGDDRGAALVFAKGVGDGWYRNVLFGKWMAAHDDDLEEIGHDEYEGAGDYDVEATAS